MRRESSIAAFCVAEDPRLAEINKWGEEKKTGGFRQTAGLDSTPCGNSVEMLMIFYG